ncbi:methyl-accepting chemotaxis protein [Nitrosomonas aestuarii]|uniref:Methyl-accepting chemotaxis protein n=2 Tax=Nitrosomonas aestuarii TaxID=52441 RepID=A0A1I4EH90_9PROT|nr:methyl-accepting chemotaxis protein [Nitrosomonas aestuarii]
MPLFWKCETVMKRCVKRPAKLLQAIKIYLNAQKIKRPHLRKHLKVIVPSINNVTEIMSDITAISRQQCLGIKLINQAVTQMDGELQRNVTVVEKTVASAKFVEDQAHEVTSAISIFKVEKTAHNLNTAIAQPAPSKKKNSASIFVILDQQNWEDKKIVNSG